MRVGAGRHPGQRGAAVGAVARDGGLPRRAPRSPRRRPRRDPARVHRRLGSSTSVLRWSGSAPTPPATSPARASASTVARTTSADRGARGTSNMRAALYYGPGDVRLEDIAEPDPTPGTVKVRSLHNGLCGTDLHQYFVGPDEPGAAADRRRSRVLRARSSSVGAGVTSVAVGDLVAIEPLWPCGTCAPCADGRPQPLLGGPVPRPRWPRRRPLGVHRRARAHGPPAARGPRPRARRPGRADVGRVPGGAARPSRARVTRRSCSVAVPSASVPTSPSARSASTT